MIVKTSELKNASLDWAVAKAKGETVTWEGKGAHAFLTTSEIRVLADWDTAQEYSPSTYWSGLDPILRTGIDLIFKWMEVLQKGLVGRYVSFQS